MIAENFAAAAIFLGTVALLIACVPAGFPSAPAARQSSTSAYELQVEEGFGHLDRLPKNWSMLPR